MYKVTIEKNDGKVIILNEEIDLRSLMYMVDKCEIKSFKIELR